MYFKFFSGTTDIYLWKSKETPEESIENITTPDNTFLQTLVNSYLLSHKKLAENCLINSNMSVFKKVINLHISYTLDPWSSDLNADFRLDNCFFRAVKLTKNADPDKMDTVVIVAGVEMSLLLELIIVLLCMLIIQRRIS